MKVPPRFELGSLDSKSRVLTITPWDRTYFLDEIHQIQIITSILFSPELSDRSCTQCTRFLDRTRKVVYEGGNHRINRPTHEEA